MCSLVHLNSKLWYILVFVTLFSAFLKLLLTLFILGFLQMLSFTKLPSILCFGFSWNSSAHRIDIDLFSFFIFIISYDSPFRSNSGASIVPGRGTDCIETEDPLMTQTILTQRQFPQIILVLFNYFSIIEASLMRSLTPGITFKL